MFKVELPEDKPIWQSCPECPKLARITALESEVKLYREALEKIRDAQPDMGSRIKAFTIMKLIATEALGQQGGTE